MGHKQSPAPWVFWFPDPHMVQLQALLLDPGRDIRGVKLLEELEVFMQLQSTKWRKGSGKLNPPAGHLCTFNMWCSGVKGSQKNLQLADIASSHYSCVEAAQGRRKISPCLWGKPDRTPAESSAMVGWEGNPQEGGGWWDLFCRARLEKMDSVKGKEKHKRG